MAHSRATLAAILLLSVLAVVLGSPRGEDWAYDRPRRQQKSQIIVVGGKRDAGSAYRYRNGFDKTNALGARKYEHNAGYGFADEIDNTNPNPRLTEWGRKYATAQSSTWGQVVPRVWRLPAQGSNLPAGILSSSNNNNKNNNNNNDYAWQAGNRNKAVFAAPQWVSEKLRSNKRGNGRRYNTGRYSYNLKPRSEEAIQDDEAEEM